MASLQVPIGLAYDENKIIASAIVVSVRVNVSIVTHENQIDDQEVELPGHAQITYN